MVRIAAVSDIHSPLGLKQFREAMSLLPSCDIFLLGGDIVERSDWKSLPPVIEAIRSRYEGEILSCFGNEEYEDDWKIFRRFKDIRWVESEAVEIKAAGLEIGLVISRGSLDRPTFWQRTHFPGISKLYGERVKKIDELIGWLDTDIKVILTHYSPTYLTLEGERDRVWSEMASAKMEKIIWKRQPDVWFHGHAHNSTRVKAVFGKTLVLNVSLPATGRITVVDLPVKVGLEKFF